MSFDAGAITSKLGLDVSGFSKGMLEANSIASIFPQTVTNFMANPMLGFLGVVKSVFSQAKQIVEGFTLGVKGAFLELAHEADNLGEAAEKVGVSVGFLSGVGTVASDAGASLESLGEAMKFLNNNAADAASGNAVTAKAFADLGMSVRDAAGNLKSGETLFFEVADAIKELPTAAQRTQAAMNLLGRGGTDLIPVLKQGSAAIKAQVEDFKKLGAVMTDELAAAGDKWGQLETVAGAAWKGIKAAVAEPILTFVAEHFEEIKATIMDVATEIRRSLQEVDWQQFLGDGLALFKQLAQTLKGIEWGAVTQGLLFIADALVKLTTGLVKGMEALGKFIGLVKEAKQLLSLGGGGGGDSGGLGSVPTMKTPWNPVYDQVDHTGSRRTAGFTYGPVTVNVPPFDTNAASSEIAAKIQTPLREQVQRQQRTYEAGIRAELVRYSL
jgi:hypothetical protein